MFDIFVTALLLAVLPESETFAETAICDDVRDLEITLMSYQNTGPKTIFGDTCSFQECNNSVKVCVNELSSCFFPSFLFGDSITFGSSLGNISNPMRFALPRLWTDRVSLNITVTEEDTGEPVAFLNRILPLDLGVDAESTFNLVGGYRNGVRLTVGWRVRCFSRDNSFPLRVTSTTGKANLNVAAAVMGGIVVLVVVIVLIYGCVAGCVQSRCACACSREACAECCARQKEFCSRHQDIFRCATEILRGLPD